MLFFDKAFFDSDSNQYEEYQEFKNQMISVAEQDQSIHVVLIELGCGTLIPTIRAENEDLLDKINNSTLIRINPTDLGTRNPLKTILIATGALSGLEQINKVMEG